jgi:hypothetical protein
MSRLVDIARERRIERLVGDILAENTPMLALMRAMNFSEPRRVSHDVVRVEMLLSAPESAQESECVGIPPSVS